MLLMLNWFKLTMLKTSSTTLHNLNLILNEDFDISSSDDDVKESIIEASLKLKQESAAEVIKETRALLRHKSSSLTLEDDSNNTPPKSLSTTDSSSLTLTVQSPSSILGTKHVCDALPILKDMKPRKKVQFNMDKNETCEIQQPELTTTCEDSSDYDSPDETSNERALNNIMDANDLILSDDSDDDCENAEDNLLSSHNSNTKEIMSDINSLEKEKVKLLKELEELRVRHDKEMKQLREEYQRRREDYYSELDEVQMEMHEKRNQYESELSDFQDGNKIKQRQENYMSEKDDIEKKEKEILKRKEQAAEQEKEINDYQIYLDRRHKTLNEKEEDLCILQDELEELSDALKEREVELKTKQNDLNKREKICNHDDAEIEKTRIELLDSLKTESELRRNLKSKEDEIMEKESTISRLEEQNKKLQIKIKHLESQISLNIKSPSSHYDKKTSLKMITGIPINEKTGEHVVPYNGSSKSLQSISKHSSPRWSGKASPSPKHLFQEENNSDYSEESPLHLYTHDQNKDTTNSNNNVSGIRHVDVTGTASFDYVGTSNMNMYAKDTTPLRSSTKATISKTCGIM